MASSISLPAPFAALLHAWRRRRAVSLTILAAALCAPLATLTALTGLVSIPTAFALALGLPLLLYAALILAGRARDRRRPPGHDPRAARLAAHVDRALPEVEESAELLLADPEELPPLGRLQRQRAGAALAGLLATNPAALRQSLAWTGVRKAAGWLAASLLVSTALALWLPRWGEPARDASAPRPTEGPSAPPTPASEPGVEAVQVRIAPPAYTGQPKRTVDGLDLEAPEGSLLTWRVTARGPVTGAALLFEEGRQPLAGGEAGLTLFGGFRRLTRSRIYQLALEVEADEPVHSSFARLVAIPDLPPEVRLVRPAPLLEVVADRPGEVLIEAEARDEYGVGDAAIIATLATGTGEQVQFREQRLAFDSRVPLAASDLAASEIAAGRAGAVGVRLIRKLDLAAFELEPGAELYYYVEVVDNRRPEAQRSRSATQRIRVPGGRGASVSLGAGLAIRPVPEYFRSQRQIIFDTEKLIADAPGITAEELRYRAHAIGFDQAALRLRYGALLGLESESAAPAPPGLADEASEDSGHDHPGHEDEGGSPTPPPGSEAAEAGAESTRLIDIAPEEFTHIHDSAEISTFFTSETRDTLRACLAAMWEAERRLRTAEPRAALPFENQALELLKLVQQAARVYVQRVGFEPPPLDPEGKRLSGELDKITSRRLREPGTAAQASVVEEALRALAAIRDHGVRDLERLAVLLDAAGRELARQALDDPLAEIAALDSIRQLTVEARSGAEPSQSAVEEVERALWRSLPAPAARPLRPTSPGDDELWRSYRRRLENGG